MASRWFSACLEKESARRTRRLTRARNVPNQRSPWLVSPSSLPQARCVCAGKAPAQASQKSLRVAPCRSPFGQDARRSPALCRLRLAKCPSNNLPGASTKGHPQPKGVRFAAHKAPKFHRVRARRRFQRAAACPQRLEGWRLFSPPSAAPFGSQPRRGG